MGTLIEWMAPRDLSTTLVYADHAPDPAAGAAFVERAFGGSGGLASSETAANQ